MCDPVSATVATVALMGGASAVAGNQQRIKTERALSAAKAESEKQAKIAEDQLKSNAQRPKQPKSAAETLYGTNAGAGSASLTGAQGVDSGTLNLGKTSLIGT